MGLIPVFYHSDMDILLRMVSICYQCGLRIFEFMHQRDNRGLRYFEHLAERANEFPDLIFGVGTVLDAVMTERYINAGANFIASPFLRPDIFEIIDFINRHKDQPFFLYYSMSHMHGPIVRTPDSK